MPLFATISSETSEINIPDRTLLNYRFSSDTSGLAKSYKKFTKLDLEIDIAVLLSNTATTASLKENEETLEQLRSWGKLKFGTSKDSCEFYRKVILTHTWGGKEVVFREIELGSAYVENFSETIDYVKRKHVIKLELQQKKDKLNFV